MTLTDWTFVIGAGAAFVVVPVAIITAWLTGAPRWFAVLTTGLGRVVGLLAVSHWVVWWFAFDYVQGEPVPNDLFPVTTALMVASTIGCVALAAASAVHGVTRIVFRRSVAT